MRLAVGCSDGDSIFPPAPWSFMSSTSSPRSTLSVATAPVASPSLDALDRLRGAAKLPGPPGAKEGALRALGALNIGK